MTKRPATVGVIVGNRGFFPSHLCSTGRAEILDVLEQEGIRAVALPVDAGGPGSTCQCSFTRSPTRAAG
jgi:hypothetical protein